MFFLWILLFIILLSIIIAFSTIEIEIKNLNYTLPKQNGEKLRKGYETIIKLYILKKIKILNLSITKTMLERKMVNKAVKKFEKKLEKDKNNFDLKSLETIKQINAKIESLDLKIYLGTEDAAITAILIGIISSGLGIILRNKTDNLKNAKFETIPIYQDKNVLQINFNGIFKINMIHIIYIIYVLKKKRRVDKNVRTSNRRAYAYSDG